MQSWTNRAAEEANLFNPAFCTALIANAVREYDKKTQQSFPFSLTFLLLPIVLHRSTREALPGSTITSMLSWVQENREHLVDFSIRVQRVREITREALLFGIQHDTLAVSTSGGVIVGPKRQSPTVRRTALFTEEARACLDRAGFLGRWFAAAGTTATIFAAWGVAP